MCTRHKYIVSVRQLGLSVCDTNTVSVSYTLGSHVYETQTTVSVTRWNYLCTRHRLSALHSWDYLYETQTVSFTRWDYLCTRHKLAVSVTRWNYLHEYHEYFGLYLARCPHTSLLLP